MSVLEVRVGEPVKTSLARFGQTLAAAKAGKKAKPHFGIGFRTMAQFGEVFTPKRWELVEFLKASGPLTIYALAKRLGRHYRNVHKDVTAMIEWTVIDKDEAGRVFVPWDEIDVRWPLLKQAA
jgi:predicted transcriptional regulator